MLSPHAAEAATLKFVPAEREPPDKPPKKKTNKDEAPAQKRWHTWFGKYGRRFDKVLLTLLPQPEGLTAKEITSTCGGKRTDLGGRVRELIAMGLVKYEGVRKQGRHLSNIVVLTELGKAKAEWLRADPLHPDNLKSPPETKETKHA